jgi:tRNA(Ile2) C34 agmatinyltransferase TiaS
MHIIARCPRCGYRWYLNGSAADRRLRCRKCCRLLRVPDLIEVPSALDVITHAQGELYVDESGSTYG